MPMAGERKLGRVVEPRATGGKPVCYSGRGCSIGVEGTKRTFVSDEVRHAADVIR